MFDAFSIPRYRSKTFLLIAICGLFAISATLLGIDDNPPGILLALLAAIAFVLAFTHPWRTARQFWLLLLVSVLGFALLVIMDIVFAAIAHDPATMGQLQKFMQGLAVVTFTIATLICPSAFLVSVIGLITSFIRNRRRPTSGPPTAA